MIYILKTEINENSNIISGLGRVYGLGPGRIKRIVRTLGLNNNLKFKHINQKLRNKLVQLVDDQFVINNDLKKEILKKKEVLVRLRTYRGIRERNKLPRRGQRTHTNAKTAKKLR